MFGRWWHDDGNYYRLLCLVCLYYFRLSLMGRMRDEFDHDAEDLGLITLSAVFWLPLVTAVLVAFLIDFWRKWVNRG